MVEIYKDTFKTLFSRLTLSILVIATLSAVFAGPFGTYASMSWAERAVFWPLVTTSSVVLGYSSYATTRCLFGYEETLITRLFVGILGTFLIASDVYIIKRLLDADAMVPYLHFLGWVGGVFFLVIAARALFTSEMAKEQKEALSEAQSQADATRAHDRASKARAVPRIVRHLPEEERAAVIRVSANDHFVHIVTQTQEYPVRMRLRDAIAETDGVQGVLVHRSHWVAVEAIVTLERDAGKLYAMLTNGDRVPVSRSYRRNVEELGFSDVSDGAGERSSASAR